MICNTTKYAQILFVKLCEIVFVEFYFKKFNASSARRLRNLRKALSK